MIWGTYPDLKLEHTFPKLTWNARNSFLKRTVAHVWVPFLSGEGASYGNSRVDVSRHRPLVGLHGGVGGLMFQIVRDP